MIVDSGVAAYSIFAPTDCHCMSEAGRRVSQSFLIEIHIQHCHPLFSQHFFSGIFRPFRNSQLSVWVTTMASMGQQVFDHGKYMEDDHTIVAMMDCAEQRYYQLHLKLVIPFTRTLQDCCMGMRLCCRSFLGCMILGQLLTCLGTLGHTP